MVSSLFRKKYHLAILWVKAGDTLRVTLCLSDRRSDHGIRCGRFRNGKTTGSEAGGRDAPAARTSEERLMDLLIALLQSLVVLLLASGVYVALVARKADKSSGPADAEPAASPRRPTIVT
jgi:hypothetical protein